MQIRPRTYAGQTTTEVSEREKRNRQRAREAAGEGVVLLKNEGGILPLAKGAKIALYGGGVANPIKGGTGSGDVNCRETVGPLAGLLDTGFTVVNEAACAKQIDDSRKATRAWADSVKAKLAEIAAEKNEPEESSQSEESGGSDMGILNFLFSGRHGDPQPLPIEEADLRAADAAVYVISRTAGEGRDRHDEPGDYELSEAEKQELAEIAKYTDRIVVVLNTGAQIDMKAIEANPSVAAIVDLFQPGMEIGHVLGDILSGSVNPSGKLAVTWAVSYEDYSMADTFGHRNGDLDHEYYTDGIYVGYRYFDSFFVKPQYAFGFGLSYTTFEIGTAEITADEDEIRVCVPVTNTGREAGREVVQVYVSCPQNKNVKELKRLVGFVKTRELAPGEEETVTVTFRSKMIASYSYENSAWVAEAGEYIVLVGNSSDAVAPAGVLNVAEDVIVEKVSHVLPLKEDLHEITPDVNAMNRVRAGWLAGTDHRVSYTPQEEELPEAEDESDLLAQAAGIACQMSNDELIAMLMGEISKGQDNIVEGELVETGIFVPGAAGETSCRFEEKFGVPAISMADGPAGLRLLRSYDVDRESGMIYGQGILNALTGGMLAIDYHRENADTYYTYATAIPIGSMLSSTWNPDLIASIGEMIGEEMNEYGIAWWLAPGMNIQRNPLCGRNFEYYSEDPFIAGTCAAAITNGVQSMPGIGTTIKHLACNNLEDNRLFSDSILSERALREIYLRGFEIAVKTAQPMCIMTSYNKINSVPACNAGEMINGIVRGEWNFRGIVMTDWTPTTAGCAVSHECANAGNDLIMPGNQKDIDEMKAAVADGSLSRETMEECAARIIKMIFQTSAFEYAQPYQIIEQ